MRRKRAGKEEFVKKICVVGLGYIGLPTAVVAAQSGFSVVGFDIDEGKVNRINQADPVIQEPEIAQKLAHVVHAGSFRATTVIEQADCFIIAVPTPFTEDKKADLSYVFTAADSIARVVKKGDVIILESTVPVGATQALAHRLENKTGLRVGDFFVAHCPERVLPGQIFKELIHNARIIGGIDVASVHQAKLFYKQFVTGRLYLTNAATAEMVKLVENSSRDVAIAFSNQVASMAYEAGLDPFEVIELANQHPRVNLLKPGCGVGGHCIAVDPWFLVETFGPQSKLLAAARMVNDAKPYEVLALVRKKVVAWQQKNKRHCTVLALGLTYKANVDDMRESPALLIAEQLKTWSETQLLVCEPHIAPEKLREQFDSACIVDFVSGIAQADIVVCLVGHTAFADIAVYTKHKEVIDVCGLLHVPHAKQDEQELNFWPAQKTRYEELSS